MKMIRAPVPAGLPVPWVTDQQAPRLLPSVRRSAASPRSWDWGWRVGLRPGACAARRAAAPGARSGPRVRSPGAGATRDHGDGAERPRGAPPAAPPLGSEVGAPRSPGLARRGVRVMARSPASSGMCSRLGVEWAGEARPGAAHRGAGRKRQVSHRTPGRSQPRTPCWEPVALSSLVRPSGQ